MPTTPLLERERPVFQPDDLDKAILHILMRDANVPYTDIARELSVSGGTIHVRMKKMQDAGVVQGARLVVNPGALGFDITAFIGVYFDKGTAYQQARQQIMQIPEVVESHYTTGVYSMFLKVICRDTRHLRQVLNEKIQGIEGVQRTETFISLEESVQRELSL